MWLHFPSSSVQIFKWILPRLLYQLIFSSLTLLQFFKYSNIFYLLSLFFSLHPHPFSWKSSCSRSFILLLCTSSSSLYFFSFLSRLSFPLPFPFFVILQAVQAVSLLFIPPLSYSLLPVLEKSSCSLLLSFFCVNLQVAPISRICF